MANVKMSKDFDKETEELDPRDEAEAAARDAATAEEEGLEEEPIVNVEDLDPSVEIWPGGPTAGQIVQWKEQYGDVYVSSFSPEHHIVWRTMTRFEYRNHVKKMEQLQLSGAHSQSELGLLNEENICTICVLYPRFTPEMLPAEMAGAPTALAQDILEASGFVALEVRKL